MARLPHPGGDSGTWGDVLNDYLSQAHKSDGTLKDNAVTANALAPNSVSNAAIASNAVNATSIADGSITESLLDSGVTTKLNATGDWDTLSNKPVVIAAGGDTAAARTAIGAGTGDASTNTTTAVDGEVALFNGTTGKSLRRATGSGLAKLTAGVLGAAVAGTDYPALNLAQSPSFENAAYTPNQGGGYADRSSTVARTGTWSLRQTGTNGTVKTFYPHRDSSGAVIYEPCAEGDTFYVEAYVYSDDSVGTVSVGGEIKGASGTPASSYKNFAFMGRRGPAWHKIYGVFTIPVGGYDRFSPFVQIGSNSTTGLFTYWDDFIVRKIVDSNAIDGLGQHVHNVKRYGAVGDGIADDTDAIQNAIYYADKSGGGVVYLPPGTYNHTGLTIRQTNLFGSVQLVGAGPRASRLVNTHATNHSITMRAISPNKNDGNAIRDLCIDSNVSEGRSGQHGIHFEYHATYFDLYNIRVSNHGDGIYFNDLDAYAASGKSVNIIHCQVGINFAGDFGDPISFWDTNIYDCGIGVKFTGEGGQITFHGGTINSTLTGGVLGAAVEILGGAWKTLISFYGMMFEHDNTDDVEFVRIGHDGTSATTEGAVGVIFSGCGFQNHNDLTRGVVIGAATRVMFENCRMWTSGGTITTGIEFGSGTSGLVLHNTAIDTGVTTHVRRTGGGTWQIPAGCTEMTFQGWGLSSAEGVSRSGPNISTLRNVATVTSSATPTINVDATNVVTLTTSVDITSMTTNLTGTPHDGQELEIRIRDSGTQRTIAWGASFAALEGLVLPTKTLANTRTLICTFVYYASSSAWYLQQTNYRPQWSIDRVSNGLITPGRLTGSGIAMTSGSLYLTYINSDITKTLTQIQVRTAGTAAGATPTLIRYGLYSVDSSNNLTLIASTPNDTTLLASTFVNYTKAFSASVSVVTGSRYAVGSLIVTAASLPQPYGIYAASAEALVPLGDRLCSVLTGQSDLPSSITAGSLAVADRIHFAYLS
ncbi:glycosyl hydrolase family 28-related protein [Mycobacteroides abscessus]|uniref:glycosyl hydrolase family 28-related protein n=1 Tax=Mycobacteroides abscessus TaxID=36809 RepID=UPI002729E4FA|nr:glycosyl hydrolase family 28-related protein [Mycobacteroides abscessus]MDM2096409.1 glycosyl hydrolase family 28-related protein [Mycobacteroides abscessus]MDM2121140.1 glycosyl hydrolase family 28-related protein [Mycobacteroides abscessus]MDM2124365.1 glycosyl hydrolase family 28-related protein [Mycobacteroides abscessus]MDM2130550.1 glycosyl hydrolase family 28-related protein [Mycobacteroides abscessus]MDM2203061.1 glycosyl hydrolase family 28-related protein [Mycobacteroides abscessu